LAKQQTQFLWGQVQAQQEQQEDNADLSNVRNQPRVGYPGQASGAERHTQQNVANDHGLARIQRQGRHHSSTCEDQEKRNNDIGLFWNHGLLSCLEYEQAIQE